MQVQINVLRNFCYYLQKFCTPGQMFDTCLEILIKPVTEHREHVNTHIED
jgi:hypothetical protein